MASATYSAHFFYGDSVSRVWINPTDCASSVESTVA